MKAKFRITNPDVAECTLTITMPLAAWKELKRQLKSSAYPGWKLKSAINDLVYKAEQEFESMEEVKD